MKIAFASGKGGTGKTLLSTAFARALADRGAAGECEGYPPDLAAVAYVDADVEEPNGHVFLRPTVTMTTRFTVAVPALDAGCRGCGACQRFCPWHAILALKNRVMVLPELCHSCGGCIRVCPDRALHEKPRAIGTLTAGRSGGLACFSGLLDVGEARSTPLVTATAGLAPRQGIVVVDCPPGTSCPVMAALEGADWVVLVTEPTPFGLHDLDLAVRLCRRLELSPVAVLNRSDLGDDGVRGWLHEQGIPLVAEIPFEHAIATSVSEGRIPLAESGALAAAVDALVVALGLSSLGGGHAEPMPGGVT